MGNFVKVSETYFVVEDEKIVGMEMLFTENVRSINGAVVVMDNLRIQLDKSAWLTKTILSVGKNYAQDDKDADESGDFDLEGVGGEAELDAE